MRNLEEIKIELREFQNNFNPAKETYKIIDEACNGFLSVEDIIKKLSEIKGTSKYPDAIKNKYNNIMIDLQKIVTEDRKKEELRVRDENTNELKALIEQLEKTKTNKKRVDNKSLDGDSEVISTGVDMEKLEEDVATIESDNDVKDDKDVYEDEDIFEKLKSSKGKKIFLILLSMVIISIVVGIIVFILF